MFSVSSSAIDIAVYILSSARVESPLAGSSPYNGTGVFIGTGIRLGSGGGVFMARRIPPMPTVNVMVGNNTSSLIGTSII